jgi:hypothetical protein
VSLVLNELTLLLLEAVFVNIIRAIMFEQVDLLRTWLMIEVTNKQNIQH